MSVESFNSLVLDRTLDLAWSLWAELGVSGWQRRHTAVAIDPEPLVIFTASLADSDRRLQDETTDWCIRYGRYLSVARLRHLLAGAPEGEREAFGVFAATVNAQTSFRWPGATEPRKYRRTGRSKVDDFCRASLVALRLRALFGVSARAEIVRVFVGRPRAALSASELAVEAGYTKRNVAESLEALRMAGLLEALPVRNQIRYRLVHSSQLTSALGALPACFPKWAPLFRALWLIVDDARRIESLEPLVAAVEARSTLRRIASDLQCVGTDLPPDTVAERSRLAYEQWALTLVTGWAAGDPRFFTPRDAGPFHASAEEPPRRVNGGQG